MTFEDLKGYWKLDKLEDYALLGAKHMALGDHVSQVATDLASCPRDCDTYGLRRVYHL